ncbi:hypothetical protein [Burkholderia vietnamiensis]|uniref:hypothetical protein n=1 Tax=Burkholderia vietnamiensis TaxID=60552 RepID=UPI00352DD5E9
MSKPSLPDLTPPSIEELRDLWRQYPDGHEVRRLIVEIVRAREVIREAEGYRQIVQKVWNEESGGSHLVALYKLRLLLQDEVRRI